MIIKKSKFDVVFLIYNMLKIMMVKYNKNQLNHILLFSITIIFN